MQWTALTISVVVSLLTSTGLLVGVRRGVTVNNSFARRAIRVEVQNPRSREFAYTILEELASTYTPDDEPLVERLYGSMAGGEGVFKITKKRRLVEIDERLATEVLQMSGRMPVVKIHDLGVSNGITTVELFERLAAIPNIEVVGSDLYDSLDVIRPHGTPWTCVFDNDGRCLQVVGCGLVLSGSRRERRRYIGNRFVKRFVWSHVIPKAETLLAQAKEGRPCNRSTMRTIRLLHPRAVRVADNDPRLSFIRHDLFQAPPQANVVRVLNLLTTGHFPLENVKKGLVACAQATLEDGVLVLGRSADEEDGRMKATAYRKRRDGTLTVLWHLNEGYDHNDLIPSIRTAVTAGFGW